MTLLGVFPFILIGTVIYLLFKHKSGKKWIVFIGIHILSAIGITAAYIYNNTNDSIVVSQYKQIFILSLAWPFIVPCMLWGSGLMIAGIMGSIAGAMIGIVVEIAMYFGFYKFSGYICQKSGLTRR